MIDHGAPALAGLDGWRPRIIALDIDGTLLSWDDAVGRRARISRAVREAVHDAYDAGTHIVLASGRAGHGMTMVADMLGLPHHGSDRLWVVASNGAVVLRYPPLDVVHEEVFDASETVREVLRHRPAALVAVEEPGVGYRVNHPFPAGELSGAMIPTSVAEMVARPVSRVIIRDPDATEEEFIALARGIGLHQTSYFVGWTAWLDIAPVGVDKASGLARVAGELGVDARDVLSIGDGRNDLEMLAWSGRGVAMGQAIEEVRAAADAVTAQVADDGVALELRRWFPR